MTCGYHDRPDLNEALFLDGMLRTGDLGYLAEGQIYITGRSKDVIIINGMNINAEEIERYAVKMPELRAGRVVVFPTASADGSSERPHVLVEVKTGARYYDPRNRAALRERVSRHLSRFVPVKEDQITLLPPGKTLKTTSGKVRRGEMKVQYEKGRFNYNDFMFSLAYAEYKATEIRLKSKILLRRFIPDFGSL
jgi:acyl-CoA synthetase (AMP-forming)/AMP-acid ligase II